jgi:hypothetical protein
MDYELRIVVEKVAISSQEVITRDTITSYALQYPTSIVELGLRHAEQIALLEKVQNIVLAEQSRLLDLGMPVCPTCGKHAQEKGGPVAYGRSCIGSLRIIHSPQKPATMPSFPYLL